MEEIQSKIKKIEESIEKIESEKDDAQTKIKSLEKSLGAENLDKETRALLQERLTPLQNTIAGLNAQLAELQKRLAGYEQDRRESTNKPLQTGALSKEVDQQQQSQLYPQLDEIVTKFGTEIEKALENALRSIVRHSTSTPVSSIHSSANSPPKSSMSKEVANVDQSSKPTCTEKVMREANAVGKQNEQPMSSELVAGVKKDSLASDDSASAVDNQNKQCSVLVADISKDSLDNSKESVESLNDTGNLQPTTNRSNVSEAQSQRSSPPLMAFNESQENRLDPARNPSNLTNDSAVGGFEPIMDMSNSQ